MGDVDWSKRWDTSAYTSMGDVDWTKRNGVGSARQFGDKKPGTPWGPRPAKLPKTNKQPLF